MSDTTTKLTNMINPEVMADMISAQLPNAIKFSGLAPIDTTLEGRPGSTLTIPKFKYIGDAADVAEGAAIDFELLDTEDADYTIKKAAKGVEITDEALLSGYGDPLGEAQRQLRMSIASKVDNDIVATALTTTLQTEHAVNLDLIDHIENTFLDCEDNIEENNDIQGVLFVSYKDAATLRKAAGNNWTRASELGDNVLVKGVFGELLGWNIVRSKKISDSYPIAVKPGAMKTLLKRDVAVETDRDIKHKTTQLTADEHYVVALVNEALCVRVTPALGSLTIASAAGSTSGTTKLTVTESLPTGCSYKYKVGDSAATVRYGQTFGTGWTAWDGSADITAATGKVLTLAVADSSSKAISAGNVTVTAKA